MQPWIVSLSALAAALWPSPIPADTITTRRGENMST